VLARGGRRRIKINDIATPALLLDRGKMLANIERMNSSLAPPGIDLRPM
jgi:D-serine deaminase-like pyridoxal phosphate-dependent protein